MFEDEIQHLRVLIANERRDRLDLLAQVVAGLGHEVIAREIDVTAVAAVTAGNNPTSPGLPTSRPKHRPRPQPSTTARCAS